MRHSLPRFSNCCLIVGLTIVLAPWSRANIPYFNGFEMPGSSNDFTDYLGNVGNEITRVPSGGGVLGYTAASGNYYAEINNVPGVYDASGSRGISVTTNFGGLITNHVGDFSESLDLYVDLTRWLPVTGGSDLVIATAVGGGESAGDFANFVFTVPTPGAVNISTLGLSPVFATIIESGWYRFSVSYTQGFLYTEDDLSVFNAQGALVGTTHTAGQNPIDATALLGNGPLVIGAWQNGFAGNVLAIDNVQTVDTPEPSSVGALCGLGLALTLRRTRRR